MTRDQTPDTRTRPTDEIDPMIPIMPREPAPSAMPDGGEPTATTATTENADEPRHDPPLDTSYATEATRHTEEIVPFVPDLTGSDAD